MKRIKQATLVLFILILLIPLVLFNFEEPAMSEIDNRMLAANPLSADGDFTKRVDNYISDRIGLRDEMILTYTVLNERLFNKMVHPTYTYGQDGYVFASGIWVWETYAYYHQTFVQAVRQLQDYCESRGVPFLLMFNPAKPAVLPEYLELGVSYDRSWVDALLSAMDEAGIHYLDTTPVLRQQWEAGEKVFNQKYDANHWNDLGAYYATRQAAELLQERIPTVHVTQPEELLISEKLETTLSASQFPIEDYVPSIQINNCTTESLYASYYKEIELHPQHQAFDYLINPDRIAEGAPRALVFQGSYMNGYGHKYFRNTFGEYIYVHDYENVLNLPYYFNIFQPECVIFEVAEYTISDAYFNTQTMEQLDLNPPLDLSDPAVREYDAGVLDVSQGETLTQLSWPASGSIHYAWLEMQHVYDFMEKDGVKTVTVKTEDYLQHQNSIKLYAAERDQ